MTKKEMKAKTVENIEDEIKRANRYLRGGDLRKRYTEEEADSLCRFCTAKAFGMIELARELGLINDEEETKLDFEVIE